MKKQILTMLVLLVSVAATSLAADKKDPAGLVSREVKLTRSFHKLVVNGNVDVILFEDNTEKISIVGDQKDSKATRIIEANGVLTIENLKSFGKRVQVVVPVKHLSSIEAGGSCRVSGVTTLESPELTLIINDACKIGVRTTGKIYVEGGKDSDECYWEVFKKNP